MSITLKASLLTVEKNSFDETIDYLNKIGVSTGPRTASVDLLIELREKPTIIRILEEMEMKAGKVWDVLKIGEVGISLYVAHGTGDGTIFIPSANVTAIHTIDEQFLEKYSAPRELKVAVHN